MLLSMLGNALLIAVVYKNANQRMRTPNNYFILNMACADVLHQSDMPFPSALSTLHVATSSYLWLITGVAGELLCRLSQFIGQTSVLVSTASLLVTALDRFFLVFYPLKRIITIRIARFLIGVCLDFCDSVHGAVNQNDHFSRIHAGIPCFYLQFWNHCWLRYHLVIIVIPCVSITAYHCYHPHLHCDWIQTETPHSAPQPTPVKSTSTGTDEPQAMLVTVVAVLIVCRFPLIFGTMACFSGLKTACSWNFLFLGWFVVCFNSGINPRIYFIFNEQFFQGVKLLLQKLLPRFFKVTNEVEMLESTGRQIKTHTPQTHESSHAWSSRYSPANK